MRESSGKRWRGRLARGVAIVALFGATAAGARQHVQIFKPRIDDRYAEDHIVSHSQMRLRSIPVSTPLELLEKVGIRDAAKRFKA